MKISELIEELQAIQAEHGPDVRVLVESFDGQSDTTNTLLAMLRVCTFFEHNGNWYEEAEWRPYWNIPAPKPEQVKLCVVPS